MKVKFTWEILESISYIYRYHNWKIFISCPNIIPGQSEEYTILRDIWTRMIKQMRKDKMEINFTERDIKAVAKIYNNNNPERTVQSISIFSDEEDEFYELRKFWHKMNDALLKKKEKS